MKKLLYVAISLLSIASLASCGSNKEEKFTPTLDKEMSCDIKVVGDYSNFEALEAEFDLFNEYYPNVRLSYQKEQQSCKSSSCNYSFDKCIASCAACNSFLNSFNVLAFLSSVLKSSVFIISKALLS